MADTVYRSVKLVLQNSTNELMTVQGAAMLMGAWEAKKAPTQGQPVAEQSSAEWMASSTEVGFGVSGFVRLGSPSGYLMVFWKQPWSGAFTLDIQNESGHATAEVIDDSHPDHVVVMMIVTGDTAQEPERSARRRKPQPEPTS